MPEYQGDFEIHLTVQVSDPVELDRFRIWCAGRHCKCVRIVLARGAQVEQPMATWRRGDTNLPAVLVEANHCAAELDRAGLPVVRVKVEADPSNADIPNDEADAAGQAPSNYFEHHIKLLRDRAAPSDQLLQVCVEEGAHLSRNAWREPAEGKEERFVTLRSYRAGRASSLRTLNRLLEALEQLGEQVIEIESEYCVYDSNLELDRGWLSEAI
jgi:hypothetical protein